MNEKKIFNTHALLSEFAELHSVDLGALESLTQGVKSRIEAFGVDKFNALPYPKKMLVLDQAVESYFAWASKYHADLENNTDGAFVKLLDAVYEQVKNKKH